MKPIRLYLDEDAMATALVLALRARNVAVTTVLEAQMVGQSDRAQLDYDYAIEQGYVLYTFNVGDFCRLHMQQLATGEPHPGIIVVHRQRYSIGEQVKKLAQVVATQSADELVNQLVFL